VTPSSSLRTADERIDGLRATLQRTMENLVELDADVTRQVLEASPSLRGRTAVAWAQARSQLTDLWRGQLALNDTLDALTRERGSKPSVPRPVIDRLCELLDGPSVSVVRAEADLACRSLTEGAVPTDSYRIVELIARMSADYQSVTATVSGVAKVWADLVPRLSELRSALAGVEAEVAASGIRRPNSLGTAERAVADAEETARSDPLALSADLVASISSMVEQARTSAGEAAAARIELASDLAAVTESIEECSRAMHAARAQREKVASKVVASGSVWADLDRADAELVELRHQLRNLGDEAAARADSRSRVAELAGRSARLRQQVDLLTDAARADLAARDELRGRLDAYRAKAQAQGRAEDPELDRLYGEASDVLFSAPCDLDVAETRVAAFQRALRSAPKGGR
jgi:hypothetical protein